MQPCEVGGLAALADHHHVGVGFQRRYFLDEVAGWILELDRGKGIPYEGNYTVYLDKKAKRLAQEGREEAARQRALDREREWIAASPRARQAKSKARIRAYDELVQSADERRPGDAQIIIPSGERLGNVVIEADGLEKGYGDRLLIDDLEFKLPPGDYVVHARLGQADAEVPVTVTRGEMTDVVVNLDAGVLAAAAPGAYRIDVLDAEADLQGNRRQLDGTYGEEFQVTLHPGEYLVVATMGDSQGEKKEMTVSVTAGERTEATLE